MKSDLCVARKSETRCFRDKSAGLQALMQSPKGKSKEICLKLNDANNRINSRACKQINKIPGADALDWATSAILYWITQL